MKLQKRIAICISGLFREWDITRHDLFRLTETIKGYGYEVDFFLTTWDKSQFGNYDISNIKWNAEIDE